MEIAVIGAGAAGMMAALTAAEKGARVTVFERQARVGRKLSVTGNGRCNLTNTAASPSRYHGEEAGFTAPALTAFGVDDSLAFFRSLGLVTVTEADGRVYPFSDSANSVVDVLRFACAAMGIETLCSSPVSSVTRRRGRFSLRYGEESRSFDRVIVACGGCAGGKVGGVRDGYELLRSLGHSITPLRPALVQLKTDGELTRSLKGVRADAAVTVFHSGRETACSEGEVQFTEYGLSGPAIFEISRAALERSGAVIALDLMRRWSTDEVAALIARRVSTRPELTAADIFTGMLHNRLGRVAAQAAGYAQNTPLSSLSEKDAQALALAVKGWRFTVTGHTGFDNAQVTVGGAHTDEFDPVTMESRLVPGLYAAGEVLDVDGDCGGFNLQWAWSSGRAAGKAAAE